MSKCKSSTSGKHRWKSAWSYVWCSLCGKEHKRGTKAYEAAMKEKG